MAACLRVLVVVRLCLEVFESRMQALEQQLTAGMQEAAAAKRHGGAALAGEEEEDEQQQQPGRRLSSSPRSASSTRRRRRWQSSGEAAHTEEEGPTGGVLQTCRYRLCNSGPPDPGWSCSDG